MGNTLYLKHNNLLVRKVDKNRDMKTVNHQAFFKNVMQKPDHIRFLIYGKELDGFTEQLIADLSHVKFRIYGYKSPFLATLSHVELDKVKDIDDPKMYEDFDFVITDDEDVAIRARLSGACRVKDINEAILIAQNNNLQEGTFRLDEYEKAYQEIMNQKEEVK